MVGREEGQRKRRRKEVGEKCCPQTLFLVDVRRECGKKKLSEFSEKKNIKSLEKKNLLETQFVSCTDKKS